MSAGVVVGVSVGGVLGVTNHVQNVESKNKVDYFCLAKQLSFFLDIRAGL